MDHQELLRSTERALNKTCVMGTKWRVYTFIFFIVLTLGPNLSDRDLKIFLTTLESRICSLRLKKSS